MKTGWKVYPILTTTGEVGSELDPVSGSWSIELNKTEEFSATFKKKDLLKHSRYWWFPWSGGLLFTHTDSTGVETPIVAGPITDYGSETVDSLELKCGGIRKVLAKRNVWEHLEYRSMSYGEIAWALVRHGMDGRPGGALPIVHGVPYEAGRFERTYEAWNLANNGIDKLLTDLSNVQLGPDIMFVPRWVEGIEQRRIEWVMYHGTNSAQSLPYVGSVDFDTTAPQADIGEPSVSSSAAGLAHRFWYTGAGEGEGTAREYAEDLTAVYRDKMPFLESVSSDADQPGAEQLRAKAAGALAANREMVDQVTFMVRANSEKTPMGSIRVGGFASVTLRGWINIPDGTRSMMIVKANGNLSDAVTLDFQEGVW